MTLKPSYALHPHVVLNNETARGKEHTYVRAYTYAHAGLLLVPCAESNTRAMHMHVHWGPSCARAGV
jgi:hypothetical protein